MPSGPNAELSPMQKEAIELIKEASKVSIEIPSPVFKTSKVFIIKIEVPNA